MTRTSKVMVHVAVMLLDNWIHCLKKPGPLFHRSGTDANIFWCGKAIKSGGDSEYA